MDTVKILIAGNDYFDNAKCSVILDNLIVKIQYKFLVKPDHLMNELKKDKFNLVILALDMDKDILEDFKENYLHVSTPIHCLFFGQHPKETYNRFFYGLAEDVQLYPFLTTPFTPIKFSDGLVEIIQNRIANIPKSTFDINSFVAIKLLFLRKFKNIPFDIFIELSKDKHIKIRNKGDQLDDDLISRYKSKGVKEFYITSNDFNNYHESIYTLPLINDESKSQKPDQKIKEIHEVLVEVMGDVGLSEEVIVLANQYSINILEYSGSKASIALMLESAIKNDYSYLYDHSYMTSVICVKVSRKINWMTSAMIEKVCMGAIFHDLYLGHAKYSYKLDVKEHDINGIPKNDRGVYFHHPTEMANILKDTDSIPQEVINIVSQHHEKVDGTGFPQKLSSLTMSPTVGLFIMVHDFVNELYRINFDCRQYANLITNTVEKYAVGNFKEIANAFEGAMMEEMQNTKSA